MYTHNISKEKVVQYKVSFLFITLDDSISKLIITNEITLFYRRT
jgi:hypothetical protein